MSCQFCQHWDKTKGKSHGFGLCLLNPQPIEKKERDSCAQFLMERGPYGITLVQRIHDNMNRYRLDWERERSERIRFQKDNTRLRKLLKSKP